MSDEDDDEFVQLGTPFAPLETDQIVSRKPEIDQTVRDERGRRRFHGAFTGGFSAGYWNTVGTAEGFTPKIFSSSRKNKYDQANAAKPEDYMDDEDFGSYGIAPKRIHSKDDFVENSFAGLRDVNLSYDDVIKTIFKPIKESIGKRLFRKMKRQVKTEQNEWQAAHLLHDEEEAKKENEIQYAPKDNFHGLGYNRMLDPNSFLYSDQKASEKDDNDHVSATLAGGRRLKISGEAFGYGALEEDDDMAVYSKDDMSQYDFSLGSIPKVEKSKTKRIPFSHSGNSIELEGFAKATKNVNLFNHLQKNYKIPELPRNWKPKMREKVVKKSRWDSSKALKEYDNANLTSTETNAKQPNLNANLRAVILGEEVVYKTGIAKPILDKKLPESNELAFDKVLHSTSRTETAKKLLPDIGSFNQKPLSSVLASKFTRGSSTIEDAAISAGLNTYKDVASLSNFEPKRALIEKEEDSNKKPTRITYEWHPHKLLCKRFSVQNPFPQYPDIVGIISIRGGQDSRNKSSCSQITKSNSDMMFSNLFQNLSDLSTFNPMVSRPANSSTGNSNKSTSAVDKAENAIQTAANETNSSNVNNKQPPIIAMVKPDTEVIDEIDETPEKPPIDLFKSIFASDEESSNDESDNDDNQHKKNLTCVTTKSANDSSQMCDDKRTATNDLAENGNTNSKLSKSAGIFAGINFKELNQNFNPCLQSASSETIEKSANLESDDSDDCYGPALPPSSTTTIHPTAFNSNEAHTVKSDSLRRKASETKSKQDSEKNYHKNKRHKEKKKRKEKRKKKKLKKSDHQSKTGKNKKRHNSSSSDSASSRSDNNSGDLENQLFQLIKRVRQGK